MTSATTKYQFRLGSLVKTTRRIRKSVGRRLRTRWYEMGDSVECCFCHWTGSRFLPAGQNQASNRLCPRCGSLERYRALCLYLKDHSGIIKQPTRLLDVATKPCFRMFCESLPNVKYVSSDLMTAGAMILSDLTQMGMASERFDIITCLHVMEHIPNDIAAFGEMARLLKPDGIAIVAVPLRNEKTLEDPAARPEDYERLYGQYDHVRYYGMDIAERMRVVGLNVEVIDLLKLYPENILRRNALYGDDRYFFRLSSVARGSCLTEGLFGSAV
jgi:SAM-dependent methyltransferase